MPVRSPGNAVRAGCVCHHVVRRVIMSAAVGGIRLTSGPDPVGSVDVALNHTARLLATQPALAAEQASEILKVVPGHPVATLFLGAARRACGDPAAAAQILGSLVSASPDWAAASMNP